jgi:glutaredoxin-related protein
MKYLLNKQELNTFNDIISINEGNTSIIDKVKKYASKGLLTISLITALLASPKISAQDKEKIKDLTKIENTNQTYAEKRVAAQQKRTENRKLINDRFFKSAVVAGYGEPMTDEEFTTALESDDKNIEDVEKDICYKEVDGTKYKINLKRYRKFRDKQSKQEDTKLDGLEGPSFKSNSCGISKAHAKEDKKEWSKK